MVLFLFYNRWCVLFVPWQCAVILLSLGCTLSCAGWGRLDAHKHVVAAFTWGDHCLTVINTQNDFFGALADALWRLPILGLLSESLNAWNNFSALLLLWLGSLGRRMGTLSPPLYWGLLFTSSCTSPTPPPRGAYWAPKEFFPWMADGALAFSCCLVVGLFR